MEIGKHSFPPPTLTLIPTQVSYAFPHLNANPNTHLPSPIISHLMNNRYEEKAVHWHRPGYNVGLGYDDLFEFIWNKGYKTGADKRPFHLAQYLEQEREYGLNFPTRVFPNGYAMNTMLSRRVAYTKAISTQLHESQRTAGNPIPLLSCPHLHHLP